MSEKAFDAIARGAADALSRRIWLRTLGAAALAAGVTSSVGVAAKSNPAKQVKKRNKRRCAQAREGCRTIVLGIPNPDEVSQIVLACCEHCLVGDFQACLEAAFNA